MAGNEESKSRAVMTPNKMPGNGNGANGGHTPAKPSGGNGKTHVEGKAGPSRSPKSATVYSKMPGEHDPAASITTKSARV